VALVIRSVCLIVTVFFIGTTVSEPQSPQPSAANVPFVGCNADGQAGLLRPPRGTRRAFPIAAEAARKLAYYKSEQGMGVLAPRGWHCLCVYGSNGYSLYVVPVEISSRNFFSNNWSGFAGPAIELQGESGQTSGRFGVAHIIARVFPAYKGFAEKVLAERIDPASSLSFVPYPNDRLIYRTKEIVEYETPANTDGLGTSWKLKKNADPISGVAMLLGPNTPDLLQLSVRLQSNLADLTPIIVQQSERDAVTNAR
jgi:hypothetical protein